MNRPTHFEIHADDPARAIAFYEKLFGWTFHKWEGGAWDYWLITTGPDDAPGINGGLLPRRGARPTVGAPVNAFVCTIDVKDVDALIAMAPAAGGAIALPKRAVPGIGWMAYLHDSEGNIFGMMQNDPGAK